MNPWNGAKPIILPVCGEAMVGRHRDLGHMDGAYRYNMSMIDNKTGQEIMVMGGSACESQIKSKFESFLASGG